MSTFKLTSEILGQEKTPPRKPMPRPIYLEDIITTINDSEYSKDVKDELIKMAKGYPQGSLRFFYSRLKDYAERVRNKT